MGININSESERGNIAFYQKAITNYDKEFQSWLVKEQNIKKRYKLEEKKKTTRYPILFSNVQTVKAATFTKVPQPDVVRRYSDNDQKGRVASIVLERALSFDLEHYKEYARTLSKVVYDRFLGGRGTCWVRYEPKFITDAELDTECCPVEYVNPKDFGHEKVRTWEEVTFVWRKIYLTKDKMIERFGKVQANKLDYQTKIDSGNENDVTTIYELWDKVTEKAYWFTKDGDDFIDVKEDPYNLDEFFPCPRPIYSTLTPDSLVPIPDYTYYESQALILDELAKRIDGLSQMLKVRGVYNAEFTEVSDLLSSTENGVLLGVKNWGALSEKGGLNGAVDVIDIQPIVQTLLATYQAMDNVKAQIYEITGLSDILRGASQQYETAEAQRMKGEYASLRLKVYQDEVSTIASDILKIKAQIICNIYNEETFRQMSGAEFLQQADQEFISPAIELLKNNLLRQFRIAVSADSMVFLDADKEKQNRNEFLNTFGTYLGGLASVKQTLPNLMPMAIEMVKFAVSGYKVGRTLEGVVDEALDGIKQELEQSKNQPPPPNPEILKIQQQNQLAQAKLQADQSQNQQRMQIDMQNNQQNNQVSQQNIIQQFEFEKWKFEKELALKREIELAKINASKEIKGANDDNDND